MTQKTLKAQALDGHLVENPVDEKYESLKTYYHNKKYRLWVKINLKHIRV